MLRAFDDFVGYGLVCGFLQTLVRLKLWGAMVREEANTCEPKTGALAKKRALSDVVQKLYKQRVDDGDAAKKGWESLNGGT